jgi:hypothetical protein
MDFWRCNSTKGKKNNTFEVKKNHKRLSLVNLLSKILPIMGDILRKIFLDYNQALFRVDKNRYAKLLGDEFEDFCKIMDTSKLEYDGIEVDRSRIRQDVLNLFHDFKKAKSEYKKEKAVLNGEG